MTQSSDTVDRILDAAEALFAERGFAETSLRTITSTAGVNLAAVNYHFGSKKELIQAVFARFFTPFSQQLELSLDELQAQYPNEAPSAEVLLTCLFQTVLRVLDKENSEPQRFMRLLGLAYTQSQGHLRRFIVANYSAHYQRFTLLLKQAVPQMDPVAFYWRLYFMLGASVFTLSSFDSIQAILKEDFKENTSIDQAVDLLIPAVSGMFRLDDS